MKFPTLFMKKRDSTNIAMKSQTGSECVCVNSLALVAGHSMQIQLDHFRLSFLHMLEIYFCECVYIPMSLFCEYIRQSCAR